MSEDKNSIMEALLGSIPAETPIKFSEESNDAYFYRKVKEGSGKKVISFSLYGKKPLYYLGAEKNIEEAKEIYPDFICRFYCTNDVPNLNRLKDLAEKGECELIVPKFTSPPIFWRMLACDDPNVDICLQRDCDSVVNYREKGAVEEWLKSGKTLHFMHDCKAGHFHKIMAGMWGILKNNKFNFNDNLKNFFNSRSYAPIDPNNISAGWGSGKATYFDDQYFLRDILFENFKDDYIEHGEENPFPDHPPLKYGSFVGERIMSLGSLNAVDPLSKDEIFIASHLSIDDQMPLNGMIRHFISLGKKVILAARESNIPLLSHCLSDLSENSLEFASLTGNEDGPDIYLDLYDRSKVNLLGLGYAGKNIHGNYSFIHKCYLQANLNPNIEYEKFLIPNVDTSNLQTSDIEIINKYNSKYKNISLEKSKVNTELPLFKKIYCVNVPERTDRWEHVEKNLLPIFPNLEKFPAVCVKPELTKYIPVVEPNYHRPYVGDTVTLSAGEYGCNLSSLLIWEKMIQEQVETCLIIEDDALFKPNAIERLTSTWPTIPEDWDVVLLGSHGSGPVINEHVNKFDSAYFIYTTACVWSLSGAKKILDIVSQENIKGPLDNFIGDNKHRLNIYYYKDLLCTQTSSPSNIKHGAGNNHNFQTLNI